MQHDKILQLDAVIHAPSRLAILSILIGVESSTFAYLKEATGTTDGNLSTHLTKLESAGYITIEKMFVGKKPQTNCAITPAGRSAFENYLSQLEQIVKMQRGSDQ
ncbi:transcriptional regulator [candidate division KSB1 bacterium]|nr:transcriptional regulator [candidate division KSB1 bacterium]